MKNDILYDTQNYTEYWNVVLPPSPVNKSEKKLSE